MYKYNFRSEAVAYGPGPGYNPVTLAHAEYYEVSSNPQPGSADIPALSQYHS